MVEVRAKEGSVRAGTGTGEWHDRGRVVLRSGTVQRQDRTGAGAGTRRWCGEGEHQQGMGRDRAE